MLNQFIIVGRIKEFKDRCLTVVVSRPTKDKNGKYGHDILNVYIDAPTIWKSVKEYCGKGDIVGIKGRITSHCRLIAEKVTFLSSRTKED